MSFIFGVLLSVSQCLSIVVVYWLIGIGLAIVLPHYLPGYDEYSALNDTQAILLVLLLWDRFFGPYASLLKGVSKTLKAAQAKRRAK